MLCNVQSFGGAVGDGVADDTAAIANTIAAVEAAAHGGIVYFPAGKYRTTLPLYANSRRVLLLGDGPQSTFIKPELAAGLYALTLGWDISTPGLGLGPYTAIEGISFHTLIGSGKPNGICVTNETGHAHSLTFRDISMEGFEVQVELLRHVYLLEFERVFFNSPNLFGARLGSQADGSGENIGFTSCTFSGGPGTGAFTNKPGAEFFFSHCSFDYIQRAAQVQAGMAVFNTCHFETDGSGSEYILLDRDGSTNPPMMSFTDCQFFHATGWNYQTMIRLGGQNGDNGLRITNPYILSPSASTNYFIRDDGVNWRSNIVISGLWYARGDFPKLKLRKRDGVVETLQPTITQIFS